MYGTDQELFWAGEFGDDYIARNVGTQLLAGKLARFSTVFRRTGPIANALELGANVGLNLRAIRALQPHCAVTGVEINAQAVEQLRQIDQCTAHHASILDWETSERFDLVFTAGVLIHLNPSRLNGVYDLMAETARRYVLIAEYYNPTPASVDYRGEADRLFKRDFAGEFLDRHSEFELDDYRFEYHRDTFAADDITWFLMRRTAGG